MGVQGLLPGVSVTTPSSLEHLERKLWLWEGREKKGCSWNHLLLEAFGGTLEGVLYPGHCRAPAGKGDTLSTGKVCKGSFLPRQSGLTLHRALCKHHLQDASPLCSQNMHLLS